MNTSNGTPRNARLRRTGMVVAAAALVAAAFPAHATASGERATAPRTVPAVAVGRLAPSGCTGTGTNVACDLYAMTGSTQLNGATLPIWGFSSTGAAGSATAPGPQLVVHQNDQVTITLHNQLTEDVSLALPGQPASAVAGAQHDLAPGAAPNGTATYTFTAGRAGTFLYEAGHTTDGARQVAMGLAGALVVLPADGTASGHAYDDEAVVVLSEIDPALNNHPGTFDMRGFTPGYRLINGKPFPQIPAIATAPGHTVLLRYVNAGQVSHPMSLLGADQLEVARDGHDAANAQSEVIAELDSGATADTLVTMPNGTDSKVTLFEEGSHLDNLGQTEADPTRVATGGMLTFLDTDAPPATTDAVGPAVRHVTVDPPVSDGTAPVTVTADVSDAASGNSTLTAAELLVDDPSIGPGFGLPMSGIASPPGSPTAQVTGSIPAVHTTPGTCTDTSPVPVTLDCLEAGKHIIYVRGLDSANNWGVVGSVVLNLPKTGPATTAGTATPSPANGSKALIVSATGDDSAADGAITAAELFLDNPDGVPGTGQALTLNRQATVVSETATIPAATVLGLDENSTHHVYVRSKDSLNLWGPNLDIEFTVDKTGPGVDGASVSPSPSNGLLSATGTSGYLRVSALVTDRDGGGALQSKVVAAEGFFAPASATPAPGTGFGLLAVDGSYNSTSENVYGLIPLSQVKAKANGTYQVYVRAKDEAGNWGPLFAMPLVVDKTAPVLGTPVTATPNPTNQAALVALSAPVSNDTAFQAAEFWTGPTDPGVGNATQVPVSYVGGRAVASVPTAGLPAGATSFSFRVKDLAGNWSNVATTTVTVTPPNAIFADTFSSGTLSSWSARTNAGAGAMAATAAANLPAPAPGAFGLATTGTGTHYLTDQSPVGEPTYHASLGFNPNTFTSGNAAAVTVFDARSNTASVFTVGYRKNAGADQVRLVMTRSAGAAVTGAWVPLPSGAHTLRVDWAAATAGSVKLSVDGTAVQTLTGNTNTLRIEQVRLGLVAGTNNSSTGTAYFDAFTSTRTTLP